MSVGFPPTPSLAPVLLTAPIYTDKFKFTKKQRWIKTPRRCLSPMSRFLESLDLFCDIPRRPRLTRYKVVFIDESQTIINDVSSPDSGPDEFEAAWDSPPIVEGECHSNLSPMPPYRPPSPPDRSRLMSISSVVDPAPPIWPLTNPEEAVLFRHFMDKLAMWVRCHPNPSLASRLGLVPMRG